MFDWRWPAVVAVVSSVAIVSSFKLEPKTVLWFGIRSLVAVLFGAFFVYTVFSKLIKVFTRSLQSQPAHYEESDASRDVYEAKKKKAREEAQAQTDERVDDYKERILTPREEAKRRQKEEEFRKFMGPAWKGKGDRLGGEDARSGDPDSSSPGAESREIRQLPPDVLLHIPKPPDTRKKRPPSGKGEKNSPTARGSKVIELPEEPSEGTPDTTVIILRSPIGTKHKRRFLRSNTLQVVLDYMTTVGFHQVGYTLSMSYPRRPLIDESETTLLELGFGGQMILNIEEKNIR